MATHKNHDEGAAEEGPACNYGEGRAPVGASMSEMVAIRARRLSWHAFKACRAGAQLNFAFSRTKSRHTGLGWPVPSRRDA